MNYIGEFHKNSAILLELLTKDEENQAIAADFSPTATIEHYDRNGLQEVDSVTLETMEDYSRHVKVYQIPTDWQYGDYIITYHVTIDGVEYTTQEKFYLSKTEDLVIENNQLNYEILDKLSSVSTEEESVTKTEEYIMPPDFQSPSTVEVVDNKIIITPTDDALYNYTYRIVLGKDITSITGERLGEMKTITFTSEYKPLFSTPSEVRSVLRSMYRYFTPHEIYSSIRDASQKAMQLLGNTVDPNNSRYRELRDTDTAFFPSQKYAMYEASLMLMTGLMVRILDGGEDDIGTGMMSETGGSITLGDFTVSDSSSSQSSGSNSSEEESPLEKLQALIKQTERELKFWQDAMMGHNRRGYAKPVSSSFRTAAGSPEGRDFE